MRSLAVFAPLLLAGCVSVQWERQHALERPADEAVMALAPGETDLAQALALLGAPLFVWEEPRGAALAWGWTKGESWGAGVSVPVTEWFSASVRGRDADRNVRGLVLIFDEAWTLRLVRRGRLREIASYAPRPPAAIESEPDGTANPR